MKIQTKFTLILSGTFLVALILTGVVSYGILYGNARQEIRERAGLMLESAKAMRTYTINNVKPLVAPLMQDAFHAETVPAFAAMTAFGLLRESHPDYTYREVAMNPSNPRNRPVEWEHDIVTHFRNFADATELTGTRQTPSGPVMFIARPIQITKASCLDCHSTPDKAPATVIKAYGETNGMGWKMDEIIGAQIVAVPESVSLDRARHTFLVFMLSMTVVAAISVVMLNYALRRLVVRPITDLTNLCDQVSKGDFSQGDPQTGGADEVGSLGRSFVRMKISLQKAMKMLEG
jgi:HAMP domain-containing protein